MTNHRTYSAKCAEQKHSKVVPLTMISYSLTTYSFKIIIMMIIIIIKSRKGLSVVMKPLATSI